MGGIYGQNRNFEFWGLYSHISAPVNVKFGTAVRSPVPNFTFVGPMCSPCGAKAHFLDH